jgi:predicted metal-dependent hydrolase
MTESEHSEVKFGGTKIAYGVRRSSRRTTVSILVDPGEGVIVRAPERTPVERLDRVVHAKARWIVERTNGQAAHRPAPREFISGESFLYLGRHFRLRVVRGRDEDDTVRLSGRWLWVPVEAPPRGDEGRHQVRQRLVRWFRTHAALRLAERFAAWSKKLGVREPRVLIRDQRRRWASCDPQGVIRLNWRVVQAPVRLVDYVVVHELLHLGHRHHTKAFWETFGRVMYDYDARREALRALGPRLEW